MSERMVVIRSYSNEFEANFAKAELEAAEIPVRLLSDGLGGVHPHLQFARGIRLAVPESAAETALELLDADFEEDGEEDGEEEESDEVAG